ncbi:MAG: hypothetical protein PF482_05570, partial [Desulfobacteraceae bacterium]|nr:hypothetical protein [Desulfobacteraceae bacterium]
QNGIFHLSHKNIGFTSETFKTDKYIDEEQAKYFSELSRPKLNTPADDNYPFTLVDHYILDSDLEIDYKYDNILCSAYPQKAYLSRHNISISDYTDTKVPPTYMINKIKGTDPHTGERVTAMHLEVHNYESFTAEILQMAPKTNMWGINEPTGTEYVRGYVGDTYVRVNSAQVAVWVRMTDTELMKKCNPPIEESSCLHPSDIRPEKKWYMVRTGNIGPFQTGCTQDPPLQPRQQCYYPFSPERTSAAATNWSYNNNLRNGSSSASAVSANSSSRENSQTTDTSCKTCK